MRAFPELRALFAEKMAKIEQEAYEAAGRPFNMASPKQIGQIFFEELELPVISKTPKGAPSTSIPASLKMSTSLSTSPLTARWTR